MLVGDHTILEIGAVADAGAAWGPASDCPLFYSSPISQQHYRGMVQPVVRHHNPLTTRRLAGPVATAAPPCRLDLGQQRWWWWWGGW